MNKQDTSWGGVAEWYDELLSESPDSFQAKVILPNITRILEPKKGMKIIDIACGQGFFSRCFAQAGAEVTASDISKELVETAVKKSGGLVSFPRKRAFGSESLRLERESMSDHRPIDPRFRGGDTGEGSISYHVAPADSLGFAKDSEFDAATIILAIQNIENMQGAISEASRALRPGGRLILILNHPSFRIPKSTSWGWDDVLASQYRRVDSYMSDSRVSIDMSPGSKSGKKETLSFHRPLQSYFKALNKANLAVTRLEEWISHRKSQKGPRSEEEDRIRKEIPMFLMMEARKL